MANPLELFYPNILTPKLKIDPQKTQEAIRRAYDFIYRILPPAGSTAPSALLNDPNFISQFTIKLATGQVFLSGQELTSTTSGYSWNSHSLTYKGVRYTIAAGGPSTLKWLYWAIASPTVYKTSSTFPSLGKDDFLIAVFDSATGTTFEFWQAHALPFQFITTAMIEDAAITSAKIQSITADQITTGTLAASVTVTLTRSDTVPAKLIWESTGQMYASVASTSFNLLPITDHTGRFKFGDIGIPLRWNTINLEADAITLIANNASFDQRLVMGDATNPFSFYTNNTTSLRLILTTTAMFPFPSPDYVLDLGRSTEKFRNLWLKGDINVNGTAGSLLVTDTTKDQVSIGNAAVDQYRKLYINQTTSDTNAANAHNSIEASTTLTATINNSIVASGISSFCRANSSVTYSGQLTGLSGIAYTLLQPADAAVNVNQLVGTDGRITVYGGGTVTTGIVLKADGCNISGTGVITNAYGMYVVNPTVAGGGSITTLVGLKLESMAAGGTNWAIQSEGGQSYHVGRMLFGLTSTDVSGTAMVASGSIAIASATTNASVGSFGGLGSGVVDFGAGKTGSGAFLPITFTTSGNEQLRIGLDGWLKRREITANPVAGDLASLASCATYMKADKFVIAYNNGGTVTYISIPMDGSTTTWTHNTTAP